MLFTRPSPSCRARKRRSGSAEPMAVSFHDGTRQELDYEEKMYEADRHIN